MMLEVWFGLSLAFLIAIAAVWIGILVAEQADIIHQSKELEHFHEDEFEDWLNSCPVKGVCYSLDTEGGGYVANVKFWVEEDGETVLGPCSI